MNLFRRYLIFLGAVWSVGSLLSPSAWSADSKTKTASAKTVATAIPAPETEEEKSFSVLTYLDAYSGLQSTDDPNYKSELDLSIRPMYRLSDNWTAVTRFDFHKELTQEQRYLADDGFAGFRHQAFLLDPNWKFTPALYARLPISEKSRNQDSKLGGGQVSGLLEMDGSAIGLRFISADYKLTLGKNFYTYADSTTGASNINYDVENRGDLTFKFTDALSFLSTLIYINGFNYDSHMTGKFEIDEELDYQLTKPLSIGIGLSNAGDALRADGQNSNLSIYNSNNSSVYGQLQFLY